MITTATLQTALRHIPFISTSILHRYISHRCSCSEARADSANNVGIMKDFGHMHAVSKLNLIGTRQSHNG